MQTFFRNKTRARVLANFVFLALFCGVARAVPPQIRVVEPRENRVVAFDHILLEGSVSAGANFSIDGREIAVGRDGLFIEWLPLKSGLNVLQLRSALGNEYSIRELRVTSQIVAPLDATKTQIDATSLQPSANWKNFDFGGSLPSRSVAISFRGSPDGVATFRVGERGPFPMRERKIEDFVGAKSVGGGIYEATFVARENDDLSDAPIVVSLRGSDGQTVSATCGGQITAQNGPLRVGIVTAENIGNGVNSSTTVARNGVARAHILPLKTGAKFVVIGEDGTTFRCQIAPNQVVNIPQNQMRLLPVGAPLPRVYLPRIETRQIESDEGKSSTRSSEISFAQPRKSTQIRFLLSDRVPFSIEQSASNSSVAGEQFLDVRLFNTETDIDYLVSQFPDDLLRDVRWTQEQDGVLRVRVGLKTRQQWGFQSFYDGNTLVLQIAHAPKIARKSRPLFGREIVVDAGHGGRESGAAGALGVDEKDLVLDIARRLATKLKARGAIPILTRDSDVTIPLYDRALLAETQNADLLVSVHANALPDGANPADSRGAGVYYFLPQAQPLAEKLLASMLKTLPEIGNDGLHFQNLALTRPSSQPSVLVETAFMTDKANLRVLMTPAGREKFAGALARGLEDFYRSQS